MSAMSVGACYDPRQSKEKQYTIGQKKKNKSIKSEKKHFFQSINKCYSEREKIFTLEGVFLNVLEPKTVCI